ncbi:MAG TPA: Hsp20/alpha crystallin family protein [Niallia sp.]|nr:Hsp20/alpha crystallin family protein [Niallia sp.]
MFPWNLFPFNKDSNNKLDQMKPQDIQKYVQEMMAKLMPDSLQNMNPESMFQNFSTPNNSHANMPHSNKDKFNYLVFETHHHVYVRIPILDPIWLDHIKIFYTSNQLIIQHIPKLEDKHTITLPAIVKRKGSAAIYKDDVLEIRIQKNIDIQYSEIDVTEMN